MKHWIRDARYSYSSYNSCAWLYAFYHFLRVMGWQWLWECDGEVGPNGDDPNHCPDGNMETAGVGSWTAVGTGVPSKVTTPLHSGTQALEIASSALNDGVRSAALLTMTNLGLYHVAIWAYNDTGSSWEVEVDNGGGFASIGSIPDNGGVWTLYHFTLIAGAGANYIRVIDNNATADSIFIDGILVFTSWFEYNLDQSGTDGVVTAPDQFSTAGSYTFVVGDIGKFVAFYDPVNFGNSGVYEITAVAAGVATLQLRSATAALTAANGLTWRMFDMAAAPVDTTGTIYTFISAGFGLESPHGTNWRLFFRQRMPAGQQSKWISMWSAPEDTDFDFSSGNFWDTGPSVQNTRAANWTYSSVADQHCTSSPYQSVGTARIFAMVEDGGDFVALYVRDDGETANRPHFFIGYPGADAGHPGIEEFVHASRFNNSGGQAGAETGWFKNQYQRNWLGSATVFAPWGLAVEACSSVETIEPNGASSCMEMLQAGPSPWSGDEWLRRVPIVRDPYGVEGCPTERDMLVGFYQARANLAECTPFDSDNYIHLAEGTVWEWMGESL